MVDGLRSLEAEIDTSDEVWRVTGAVDRATTGNAHVDLGNAGTVARFLPAVAALTRRSVSFDGDPRIRERPLAPLIAALRDLGVDIDDDGKGALPLTVQGRGAVPGGEVTVDASESSQLVSGLLLAAPLFDRGVTVIHDGAPLPSAPHVAMTVGMLREAGVDVTAEATRWHVDPGPVQSRQWRIEPDLSSAAPFLAAAVVTAGTVRVRDWPETTTQPGAVLPDLFGRMGAAAHRDGSDLVLTGPDAIDGIDGIDVDLHEYGELTPVVAAVAALARTPTRIRGVGHLRRHETDRLAALVREISALGGEVGETDDGLVITPRPLHGGNFETYEDHRLAMAAAVLGLAVDGVGIVDVATTRKTLPDFTERWLRMIGGTT